MGEHRAEISRASSEMKATFKQAGGMISSILGGVTVNNYSDIREMKSRSEIASAIKRLKVSAVSWVHQEIPHFYRIGGDSIAPKLKAIHVENFHHARSKDERNKDVQVKMTETSLYIMKAINSINGMASKYFEAVGDAARKLDAAPMQLQAFDKNIRQAALDIVDKGYRNAEALGVIKRDVLDFFEYALEGEDFIEIGGRLFAMDAYAEMLARTELMRTIAKATTDECKDWGDDLVMVSSHSNPCDVCADLEGQVFSISGSDDEYDPLPDWPPHPNCEHDLAPTSREIISLGGSYAPPGESE